MDKFTSVAARLLMSLIFIIAGFGKLTAYSATETTFASLGLPWVALVTPLVILLELGGGLALLAGFQTRLIAGVLALYTIATALIAHSHLSDQGQAIHFMKNLAIAGGFLLFVRYGAGAISIDERKRR